MNLESVTHGGGDADMRDGGLIEVEKSGRHRNHHLAGRLTPRSWAPCATPNGSPADPATAPSDSPRPAPQHCTTTSVSPCPDLPVESGSAYRKNEHPASFV